MSEEKRVRARVQNKRKTEAEWYLDVYDKEGNLREDAFVPLKGEIIIFAADQSEENPEGSEYDRFKFGDGITNVIDLPFVNKDILNKIEEVKENIIIDITDNLPTENINSKALYRLFSATFIHNRHIVDNSICYCVENLPEIGEPATDGNQSITAYYNMSDKQVYGYLNEILALVFGIPAGWYDAGTLLAAQGWNYAGVISDITLDPNDSAIRVLLNAKVYAPINNSYKEITNDELNERFPVITEAGHWVHTVQNREGKEPEYTALPISHSPNDTAKYQIPLREDGVIKTQAPRERLDATNKEYVDAQIQDKAYGNAEKKYHTTNIHYYTDEINQGNASIGLHQNAEESEQEHIPLRQRNGLMTANVPENAPDNAVVNKGYVAANTAIKLTNFDESWGHNRVFYLKNGEVLETTETSVTAPEAGKSIMVCALNDEVDGDYSYIDANGNPIAPPSQYGWEGALATPIVTINNGIASWEPIEGATKYSYIIGTPTAYNSTNNSFASTYNRVYVERTNGRGVYSRYVLTTVNAPKDPDPADFAENTCLDSVPMRMNNGYIMAPIIKADDQKALDKIAERGYSLDYYLMPKSYTDSYTDRLFTLGENKGLIGGSNCYNIGANGISSGMRCNVNANQAFALGEDINITENGWASFAVNKDNTVNHAQCFVAGRGNESGRNCQAVFGQYAAITNNFYMHVGVGSSPENRKTGFGVTTSGNAELLGNLWINGTPTQNKHAATKKYVDDAIKAIPAPEKQDLTPYATIKYVDEQDSKLNDAIKAVSNQIPAISQEDEGKFLTVVNGVIGLKKIDNAEDGEF